MGGALEEGGRRDEGRCAVGPGGADKDPQRAAGRSRAVGAARGDAGAGMSISMSTKSARNICAYSSWGFGPGP